MNRESTIARVNELARLLYAVQGHIVPWGHRFDVSPNPQEQSCWEQALRADTALMSPQGQTALEPDANMTWRRICGEQGWNEESQIVHLEGFIRDKGLLAEFVAYAQVAAAEENQGAIEVEHQQAN